MSLATRFIDEFVRQLNRGDAVSIGKLVKLKNERYLDVYFKEDAKRYLNDKLNNSPNDLYIWTNVMQNYMSARNNLVNEDLANGFESLTKAFKLLIELIKVLIRHKFFNCIICNLFVFLLKDTKGNYSLTILISS